MVSGNHDMSNRLEYRLEGSKRGTESLMELRKYRKGDARWKLRCYKTGVTMDVGRRVLLMKSWVVMRVIGGEDECVAEGDLRMVLWECIGNYKGSR